MENYTAKVIQEPAMPSEKDVLTHSMGALHMTDSQFADQQQWIRNHRDFDRSGQHGMYYYEQGIQWVLQRLQHTQQRSFQQQPVPRAHERFEHPQQRSHHQQRNFQQSYNNSPSHQNRNNKAADRERRENKKTRNNQSQHERNFKWHTNGKSHSFAGDDNKRSYNQTYRSLSPTPPGSSKSSSPGAPEKGLEKDGEDSGSTASSGGQSYAGVMKVSMSAPLLVVNEPSKHVNQWIDNNFGALHNAHSFSAEHLNLPAPVKIIKRPPTVNNKRNLPQNPSYDPQHPFEYYLARCEEAEMRDQPVGLRSGSKWDRLSTQMWDKFQVFQQSRGTYRSKILLWKELHNAVKNFPLFHQRGGPKWGLFLVGSTISGFGSDTSDIDMCLVSTSNPHSLHAMDVRGEAMLTLNDLRNYLMTSISSFQNFSLINAKVPILRFRDLSNTIEIDLNYNNCVGVRNTHLLFSYAQMDWRLRPLALIVKLWAQHHNINDARNSTISSYSLVLMVIHFLQYAVKPAVLPCLHELCPDKFNALLDITTIDMVEKCDVSFKSKNRQPIGELFLRFLDYFSNFDYSANAISIRTGGVLPIEECRKARSPKNDPNHWQTLCIEEPFDLTNTARSAYDQEIFQKIKNVFFASFFQLKETRNLESVFQEPLFTQQQPPQHINPMKYMMMMTTTGPMMASDVVKS